MMIFIFSLASLFGEGFFQNSTTAYIFIMGGLFGDQILVLTLLLLPTEDPVSPQNENLPPHVLASHNSTEAFKMQVSLHTYFLPSPKLLFTT